MQEGVHQSGIKFQIGGRGDVRHHGVFLGQGGQRLPHHQDGGVVLAQPQLPEHALQHLDADAAVFGVQHQRHHTLGPQTGRQGLQACFWFRQVVQDAGGDDQIEVAVEARDRFDRQSMQLQVLQPVAILELLLMLQRRLTDVDGDDVGLGVRVGEHRSLIGAAARDQDIQLWSGLPVRPEQPLSMAGIEPLPVVL